MRDKVLKTSIITAVITTNIAAPNWATAQNSTSVLEEITVTARRVSESLQDVPVAVTAFSRESIKTKELSNVAELGHFTPNVTLDFTAAISGSSSALTSFIRGIGQSDFAITFEPGVGLYIDGVYFARTIGGVVDLLDVQSVEILKGPQGTLFGRNTIGGAINVVTREVPEEFEGSAEVTIGDFNRMDVRGSVALPIIEDKLYSSISYSSKSRDGYVQRIPFDGPAAPDIDNAGASLRNNLPALGNENNETWRTKFKWLASDDVTVNLSADYVTVRETSSATTLIDTFDNGLAHAYNACLNGEPGGVTGPPTLGGVACGEGTWRVNVDADPYNDRTPYDDRFLTGDIDKTYNTGLGYTNIDNWGISANIDWAVSDAVNFKSITAFRDLQSEFGRDSDGSPLAIDGPSYRQDQDQLSQEFQLSGFAMDNRLKWLTGLYYFTEEGFILDLVPLGVGLIEIYGPNYVDNEAWAAFGQATYSFTDAWSLTLGVRYTEEDKEFEGAQRDLSTFGADLGIPPEAHPDPNDLTLYYPPGVQNASFSNVAPRIGLEFKPHDDMLLYASYSKGFKSGGWSTRLTAPVPSIDGLEFDEEEADAYEIGLKSEWMNRRLRVNAAAFFTDYSNLQLIVQEGVSPLTQNAGESEIQGFELEIVALPSDNLMVSASLGYTDAEYTKLDPGVSITFQDEFQDTPELSGSMSLDYNQPLGSGAEVKWHLDYSYSGEYYNNAVNQELLKTDEVNLWNGIITYVEPGQKWEVAAGVKNISDERYIIVGQDQMFGVGFVEATYSRPREWFMTLRYNF